MELKLPKKGRGLEKKKEGEKKAAGAPRRLSKVISDRSQIEQIERQKEISAASKKSSNLMNRRLFGGDEGQKDQKAKPSGSDKNKKKEGSEVSAKDETNVFVSRAIWYSRLAGIFSTFFSRHRSRLRQSFFVFGCVALSSVFVFGTAAYLRKSQRFSLKEVQFLNGANGANGSNETEDAFLLRTGLKKGDNLFLMNLPSIQEKLYSDPWVQKAHVSRKLPGTLLVSIEKKEAFALVSLGELFLVAQDGAVIKKVELGDPLDLPLVTGIPDEDPFHLSLSAAASMRRALDLVSEYEDHPLRHGLKLQEVHLDFDDSLSLVVGRQPAAPITLKLGLEPYRKKLEYVTLLFNKLLRAGKKVDVIYADNDDNPNKLVAKLRE